MDFSDVIGQKHLKAFFKKTVENGRIPHAQLFVGRTGSGLLPMAIAYSRALLCSQHTEDSPEYTSCGMKVDKLVHPDLHFVFPVNTTSSVKKHPVSNQFLEEWREFVSANPYGSLFEWLQQLGIENKQGSINVDEATEIAKALALKSFEGGYKIMIIWMAEKMNTACANKILKIVEEPPQKTVLLLLAENEEAMLTTIHSRCQKLYFPLLSEEDIASQLSDSKDVEANLARRIAHRSAGDYNNALHILDQNADDLEFEKWFVDWVRMAFRAKGNKAAISELLKWSENLAGQGRETQKKFLSFCIEVFRQAMLKNYTADSLLYFEAEDPSFDITKFSPFVHQNNIFDILNELEDGIYHIERNGNAKIIFSDLSIRLTRLIHRKELA
ncbi:DNA polymerase III subunit delta' [Aureitalea sp. L0-47]|uniref:DNA polymerase III subunit n=1 Tax=Aureitalea sp. L0-47 TaxID=2816962 RepID=UPI0022382F40|nr:DNA polymerase III subunit delta' [Aureitalea sp. L0-47]MCW5519938.1 DNA polymerase III subunit delta' [Aureitalea sp. L0-47]